MNETDLRMAIRANPHSIAAQAYRMGLKDKSAELSKEIEKFGFGIKGESYRRKGRV